MAAPSPTAWRHPPPLRLGAGDGGAVSPRRPESSRILRSMPLAAVRVEPPHPSPRLTPGATADEHRPMLSEPITIGASRSISPTSRRSCSRRALMAGLYPPESCHGLDLHAYAMPEVTLFVARAGSMAVGCGALQRHGDRSAEVKSMFVIPEARGRGIGRAILETIEAALPACRRAAPGNRDQAGGGDPPLRGRVPPARTVRQLPRRPALRVHGEAALEGVRHGDRSSPNVACVGRAPRWPSA